MRVRRVEIKNYKSLKHVILDDVQRLNVIIGRNNSGKSNVLDALKLFFNGPGQESWLEDRSASGFTQSLWHNYDVQEPIELNITFQPTSQWFQSAANYVTDKELHERLASSPISISKMIHFVEDHNMTHFLINSIQWADFILVKPIDLKALKSGAPQGRFIAEGQRLTSPAYRHDLQPKSIAKQVLVAIDRKFAFVPAKRRVAHQEPRATGSVPPPFDGTNLKNTLHKLKNSGNPRDRERFRAIKEKIDRLSFATGVMESVEADQSIDLTFDREYLSFPLSSQGTGIQEILVFIVNLMLCKDHFFGIEEPENHLHYDGQMGLLDIFEEESERNQIFVTSHSSLFVDRLDHTIGSVYLTKLGKVRSTEIQNIGGPEQYEMITDEIGNLSSLLNPNAVVFVEGPSDESIFRNISGTIKAFSRARIEFINMTGRDKLPYFAAIKLILNANKDLPFFYIIDGTPDKDRRQMVDELCRSAKKNVELNDDQIEILRSRIFVLSKSQIEAYLLRPVAIARVFQIPEEDVKSWLDKHSEKGNKFRVLDGLLRKHGRGKYDKKLDGARIAKALTQEEIDNELATIVEQIVELTRMRDPGRQGR